MSVKKRAFVSLAFLAFAWVTTFHAPRPLANNVPVVPKDSVSLYWKDFR